VTKRIRKQVTCNCDAYAWPHREFGGACEGDMSDCTCYVPHAGPRDTEPPELKRDKWCPIHGQDADYLRDRRIDDEMTGDWK